MELNWAAIGIALAATIATTVLMTLVLEKISPPQSMRVAVALFLLAGFIFLDLGVDPSYAGDPALFGLQAGMVGTGAGQLGRAFRIWAQNRAPA